MSPCAFNKLNESLSGATTKFFVANSMVGSIVSPLAFPGDYLVQLFSDINYPTFWHTRITADDGLPVGDRV